MTTEIGTRRTGASGEADQRRLIRAGAITTINSGDRISASAIQDAAGLPAGSLEKLYPSVDAVLLDLVKTLLLSYVEQPHGLARRRSARQLMAAGLDDFWARARDQVDSHRAVHIVQTIRPDLIATNTCLGVALDKFPVIWTQRRLQDVGHTQNARWDMPLNTLARLVVATINGIISAVVERDPGPAEVAAISELFAYHLSQHSIRNRWPGITRSTP